MKNYNNVLRIALFAILSLSVFLRFFNLDTNPPGVHADEADSGYNAYSLLKTGRDFYGNFLPIQITGFAENYRTPLSTYLTIPFIAIFGLSPFTIRLPAAILGCLFVLAMYLLSKTFFKSERIALIVAFVSAVNPWAVHISRAYADHILALFFVALGIFLIFKKQTPTFLGFAGFLLGLSLFSYHAPKIFLPLFIPVLLIYFGKKVLKEKVAFLTLPVVFGLFFLLIVFLSLFHKGAAELSLVSVFDSAKATKMVDRERRLTDAPLEISSIFHSKPIFYTKEFLRNYFRSLSINYLYLDGEGNLTAWIGDRGLFYLIELPFFLIGIFMLLQKNKRLGLLLLFWILVAAIPGSITKNEMYTYRNIYVLIPMLIFTGYGINSVFSELIPKRFRMFSLPVFVVVYLCMIVSYFFHYFFDYPVYARPWWAADQKDALLYAYDNKNKYERVYVNGGRDWPLLFALYTQTNPSMFQDAIKKVKQGSDKSIIIDKFRFEIMKTDKVENVSEVIPNNSLYIGGPNEFPESEPIKVIRSREDWGTLYKIFEVKNADQ